MILSKVAGQTIKGRMKEKRYTQQRLANKIDMSGNGARTQISGMLNGKRSIGEDYLMSIADVLDLDWKTLVTPEKDNRKEKEINALLAYLATIGIEITPGYYWDCYRKNAIDNYELMRQFFTPQEKARFTTILEKIEDSRRPKTKRVVHECIALTCDPFTVPAYCQAAEQRSSEELPTLPELRDYDDYMYRLKSSLGGFFFVGYEVHKNGKKIGVVTHEKFMAMIENVRATASALAINAI